MQQLRAFTGTVRTATARQQLLLYCAWRSQKELRGRTSALLQSLGKRVTAPQAKRLDALDLTIDKREALCEISLVTRPTARPSTDRSYRRAVGLVTRLV